MSVVHGLRGRQHVLVDGLEGHGQVSALDARLGPVQQSHTGSVTAVLSPPSPAVPCR